MTLWGHLVKFIHLRGHYMICAWHALPSVSLSVIHSLSLVGLVRVKLLLIILTPDGTTCWLFYVLRNVYQSKFKCQLHMYMALAHTGLPQGGDTYLSI